MSSIGDPWTINGKETLQNIVNFNVAARDRHFAQTGSYMKIFMWTFDDETRIKWLLRAGMVTVAMPMQLLTFLKKTLKFCSPIDCVNDQTCAGIDGIITNKPKQLAKLLKSRFWVNETREKNT